MKPTLAIRGLLVFKGHLDRQAQEEIRDDIRAVAAAAPFFQPVTPTGRKMRVRMTSAGSLGWVTDRTGYRYERRHPAGTDWPPIPASVLTVWRQLSGADRDPDSCLVNYYDADAKMGLHQDKDEVDLSQPVLSVSLGDDALFRIGNLERGGPTESVWLGSGDVVVMGGESRLRYHGIDRIRPGSSDLLARGGRLNLTLRVAGQSDRVQQPE